MSSDSTIAQLGITATGTIKNDKIDGTSRNDVLDGGAGSDEVNAGSGNDTLIYNMSQNVGARDRYDGGSDIDTLRINFTAAEWASAAVKADVARYAALLAPALGGKGDDHGTEAAEGTSDGFNFKAFGLEVRNIEKLQIYVNGVLTDPTVVTTVNHAPVVTNTAAALAGAVTEDAALTTTGQLSATDVDAGATQTWSVQGATAGIYGSLALNSATGQWTYTLNNNAAVVQALAAGETHTESFTVRVTDDKGAFANQTVVVTVNGTNDATVITGIATASLTETDAALSTGGALSATDVDGSAAFVARSGVAGCNGHGVFAIDATGAWTYSAGAHNEFAAGQSYTDSFTVAAADGTEQVVTVTIAGTNDTPVISGTITGAFSEDTTSSITGRLTATDPDQGAQRYWSVEGGAPAQAADYHFRADSFTLTRNGVNLLADIFSDNVPPHSPGNPTYGGLGTFTEAAGKLLFDSGNAVPFVGVGTPDPLIGQDAIARTNIDPANTTSGLKLNADFTINGVFDLVVPDSPRETYGIRALDRLIGGNGTPPDQLGDDTYELSVRQNPPARTW